MLIKNGYIIDPAYGRAEFADLQISEDQQIPLCQKRNLLIFRFLMGKFFQSDSIFQFPRQKRSLMLQD